MITLALAIDLARVLKQSLKRFLVNARRYPELSYDESHLFWKGVQAAVFTALMPVFLALGVIYRMLGGSTVAVRPPRG